MEFDEPYLRKNISLLRTLFIFYIFRNPITTETKGLSIDNIIEAMLSQLGPEKVSTSFYASPRHILTLVHS